MPDKYDNKKSGTKQEQMGVLNDNEQNLHQICTESPGAGIMEADDRQVTTVFTVQSSFNHEHSTKWSVTIVGERWGEVWLHVHQPW